MWGAQLCILQRQQPGYLCKYEAQGKPLIKDWKHFWTLFHIGKKLLPKKIGAVCGVGNTGFLEGQ